MSSIAHSPAAFEIRIAKTARRDRGTGLRLLPSGDGWSLVAPGGKVVFQALGTRGRRECLEFARAQGVLAVFS